MKRLLITLVWILISCSVKGQMEYLKYPAYNVVISKFFNEYSIKNIPASALVYFEKRPTGWHIKIIDYSEVNKTIKDVLFWNGKSSTFQEIDFDKINELGENKGQIDKFLNDFSSKYFSICPYYGYTGWDWDVINAFKDEKNLPDSTLYALGRAYSSYANNLLNNNSGFADSQHQFVLTQGKNCMTNEQLEKYRYYRHLAIKKFNEVTRLNPKYETIVGAIGIKASNEYLTSFLDLRIHQNEEEAKNELIAGLYTDFYISAAKNYLNSCAPNAILFTNGDNDTYPLLYVQSQYGFRTDVSVVNLGLLQTTRYINSFREKILDAAGLPVSLTPEELSGNKREVILIEMEDETPIELNDLIHFVKNDKNTKLYGSTDYYYVPSNKFRLKHNDSFVEWEVRRRYFYRSELIILDLLSTNKWERPVYFAVTCGSESYFGLDDYLELEGLAYRLGSTKKDTTDEQMGSVNSSIMYANLITKYDWSGLDTISSHEKLFCINYRSNCSRLAEALIRENKPDSAKVILDKGIKALPNEIVYYDFFMIPLMESYYKLKEFEKANKIAKTLIYNIKNNINIYNEITLVDRTDQREAAMKKLEELALQYNQQEILKLLK